MHVLLRIRRHILIQSINLKLTLLEVVISMCTAIARDMSPKDPG